MSSILIVSFQWDIKISSGIVSRVLWLEALSEHEDPPSRDLKANGKGVLHTPGIYSPLWGSIKRKETPFSCERSQPGAIWSPISSCSLRSMFQVGCLTPDTRTLSNDFLWYSLVFHSSCALFDQCQKKDQSNISQNTDLHGFFWSGCLTCHSILLHFLKIKQGHFCKVMDVGRETGSSILYSHLGNSLQS